MPTASRHMIDQIQSISDGSPMEHRRVPTVTGRRPPPQPRAAARRSPAAVPPRTPSYPPWRTARALHRRGTGHREQTARAGVSGTAAGGPLLMGSTARGRRSGTFRARAGSRPGPWWEGRGAGGRGRTARPRAALDPPGDAHRDIRCTFGRTSAGSPRRRRQGVARPARGIRNIGAFPAFGQDGASGTHRTHRRTRRQKPPRADGLRQEGRSGGRFSADLAGSRRVLTGRPARGR